MPKTSQDRWDMPYAPTAESTAAGGTRDSIHRSEFVIQGLPQIAAENRQMRRLATSRGRYAFGTPTDTRISAEVTAERYRALGLPDWGNAQPRDEATTTDDHMSSATAVPTTDVVTEALPGDVSSAKKSRKRPNYLQHWQRCTIIERIAGGEQQAALAREYGVTRAAVNHIYRDRAEILARGIPRAPTAQGDVKDQLPTVIHVQGNTMSILLDTLRSTRTQPQDFHEAARRIMTILVEEAVIRFGVQTASQIRAADMEHLGQEREHEFCGVTLGNDGLAFPVLFQLMEGGAPTGSIDVELEPGADHREWCITRIDVPVNIADYKVLLFTFSCGTGGGECKAIEALRILGIAVNRICIVAVQCVNKGLVAINTRFPDVRVVTAAIDAELVDATVVFPGLTSFMAHHGNSHDVDADEDEEKADA